MRASVCASTADVGSTRTSTGRIGGERAGELQPLLLAAGELTAGVGDPGVKPGRQRVHDVGRRGSAQRVGQRGLARTARVEFVAEPSGEQPVGVVADQDGTADGASRQVGERDAAVGDVAAENLPSLSAIATASGAAAAAIAVIMPGRTTRPDSASTSCRLTPVPRRRQPASAAVRARLGDLG